MTVDLDTRTCPTCGTQLVRGTDDWGQWQRRRFCSPKCAKVDRQQRLAAQTCVNCGKVGCFRRQYCRTCHRRRTNTGESAVIIDVPPRSWVAPDDVPCHRSDPDAWFDDPHTATHAEAKRLCIEVCPASADCYAYAVDIGTRHGIWGGVWFGGRR